jgi:ketosteroid isomerase-like protein
MGKLDFSELDIQLLGADYANVSGRFHLAREATGGGEAKGVFTLLFHKTGAGWRIIQDHTS